MRNFGLFLLLVAALGQFSCNSEPGESRRAYSGAPGELMVLIDDFYWESQVGEALKNSFMQAVPGLPQGEPMFDVQQIPEDQFGGIFETHRNVFRVVIKDFAETNKSAVETKMNKWAKGQLVISIYADSEDSFISLFEENKEAIVSRFNQEERKRVLGKQRVVAEPAIEAEIKSLFGIRLAIPKGFKAAKDSSDFYWLKRDQIRNVGQISHDANQAIYIYKYPYVSETQFRSIPLSLVRDSLTKNHIPGPDKGSYMTTEYLIDPRTTEVALDGRYAVEQRGLWKTDGAFMGGPFITLTALDSAEENIITVGAYAFAPKFEKREYVRELEAVLYSWAF